MTPTGDALFPKAYGELTNELLGYLADDDPETVDRLFARRRDARIANAQRRLAPLQDLGRRVAELTRILDEDGYLASWEAERRRQLPHRRAQLRHLGGGQRYGQACTSEIEFIRAVLADARVERVQHMVEGARRCAYLVTPLG